jgi:hypothetical protein
VLFAKYNQNNKVKEGQMGGALAHMRRLMHIGFWWESQKEALK